MPADPMSTQRIGIIGAGPGGLALGILLTRTGFHDFTIFDREDDVGGTWRINSYPGLARDVKSHLYSYSFDLNPHWSRLWSPQPEILGYFQRCADEYGPRTHLKLRTEIHFATRDEDTRRWCLTTADGAQHHFDVVVSAVGLFTRPLLPDLVEQEPFTNGRAVTQWPRSARSFWGMTRRFKPTDFNFAPPAKSAVDDPSLVEDAVTTLDRRSR
jgi:cyclohexanone monooxygenase